MKLGKQVSMKQHIDWNTKQGGGTPGTESGGSRYAGGGFIREVPKKARQAVGSEQHKMIRRAKKRNN